MGPVVKIRAKQGKKIQIKIKGAATLKLTTQLITPVN